MSYKEALLSAHPVSPSGLASQRQRTFLSAPSLPPLPPRFLLNPSLRGRCFRCFAKGHRAVHCREPRRCLLCMRTGHPAARCSAANSPPGKEPSERRSRPASCSAFLPPSPPLPAGPPALVGRVAGLLTAGLDVAATRELLPGKLAVRFGGAPTDYKVASYHNDLLAITFPSWLSRESAISRSPLWLNGTAYSFTDWVERGEVKRGHLIHKAWLRMHNWPLLCWNEADVKAAVSGIGELWEVDDSSRDAANVAYFRLRLRCQDARLIPERMVLMVEDRRFLIQIEIESWEEAAPILFGESLDARLELTNQEDQDRFISTAGLTFGPAAQALGSGPAAQHIGPPSSPRRGAVSSGDGRRQAGCDTPVARPLTGVLALPARSAVRSDRAPLPTTPARCTGHSCRANRLPARGDRGLPLLCSPTRRSDGGSRAFFPPSVATFPPLALASNDSAAELVGGTTVRGSARGLGLAPHSVPAGPQASTVDTSNGSSSRVDGPDSGVLPPIALGLPPSPLGFPPRAQPDPLVLDPIAPQLSRRSSRLAAKPRVSHKSASRRSRRLRRSLSKTSKGDTRVGLLSPSSPTPPLSALVAPSSPPRPGASSGPPSRASLHDSAGNQPDSRDVRAPLSSSEILLIKRACGIFADEDNTSRASSSAPPPLSGVPPPSSTVLEEID